VLNEAARERTSGLLRQFSSAIGKLNDETQLGFDEIRGLATDPQPIPLRLPDRMYVPTQAEGYTGHLFVGEDQRFPCKLNTWEQAVIAAEQEDESFVGWFRNPDRKKWSLTVPYEMNGKTRPLYPDFLSFRRMPDGSVGMALLDPHLSKMDDAAPKAVGLAQYAGRHGNDFERIEIIRIEKGRIQRLDLRDDAVREKVAAVLTNVHLQQLFELLGS